VERKAEGSTMERKIKSMRKNEGEKQGKKEGTEERK
jgi:hypothetical protein